MKLVSAGFSRTSGVSLKGTRTVYDAASAAFVATAVHDHYALTPEVEFEGPLIIEERESTVVVPRSAKVRCNDSYNLIIDLPISAT